MCIKNLCQPASWCFHAPWINNTYIRMRFVDFSSTFNTISPMKLIGKLSNLGLSIGLPHKQTPDNSDWWSHSSLVLNIGAHQGCVLSPLLFTPYFYNCSPGHGENYVVTFADNTIIIDQISNNDETSYREEINNRTRTAYSSTLAKPRSWSLILENKGEDTPLSTSVELR